MPPEPHKMLGVALITGAASGIGRATAHTFVREGCTRLILADINFEGLSAVMEELKGLNADVQTCNVKCDTSSEAYVQSMIDQGVSMFGELHYTVNNAGITSNPRRAEIRQMLKQEPTVSQRTGAPSQRGAIVNISSVFAKLTYPNVGAYSASKAGVLGLTRTDAVAYAKDGIRVNAVLPGFIKTPLVEESMRRGANYEPIIGTISINRWGMPEEIAEAVVFLCSERATLITGEDLTVDGAKQWAA